MNPKNSHCPFCNADLALSPAEAASPRIHCPRCGDSFPNRLREAVTGKEPSPAPVPPGSDGLGLPVPAAPSRPSNATVGRVLLAGMAAVALAALGFALLTAQFRRDNDYNNRPPSGNFTNQPAKILAPADLPALGYLPTDCRLLAGFHVAQVNAREDGRDLLKRLRQSGTTFGLAQLEKWTGLEAVQFDHVVLGVHLGETLPRLTVVARTRQKYDLQTLARALAPAKPRTFRDRPVYPLPVRPLSGLLWCCDDRTLVAEIALVSVADLQPADLKNLPVKPRSGIAEFNPSVRAGLKDKMLQEAFLWTVGDVKDISLVKGFPLLKDVPGLNDRGTWAKLFPPALRPWLTHVDTFRAGCRFQKGITLDAALKGRDEAAARQIQEYLEKYRPAQAVQWTVIGPSTEEPPAGKADNSWVILQMHARPEQMAESLQGLGAVLPKR